MYNNICAVNTKSRNIIHATLEDPSSKFPSVTATGSSES